MGIVNYTYNRSTSGGEIITHLINSSDGQGLHFNGSTGFIDIPTVPDLGTKFSFEFIVQADAWADSTYKYLVDFGTGGRFIFGTENAAGAKLAIYDNTSWKTFGVAPLDDLKVHHLTVTIDSTVAKLYDNGNLAATVTISASHAIDSCTDAKLASSYDGSAGHIDGTLYRTRFWNKTLTAAEVTASYENASVPFADQYGSQTSLVDAAASVFTSGTYGWTAEGSNSIANVSNTLAITYGNDERGASETLRNSVDLTADLTVGKKYRFTCDAKYAGGASGVQLEYYDNVGATTIATSALTTSLASYSIEFTATSATGNIIRLNGLATSNVVTIDNWYVREIGCVSDYDLAFANPSPSPNGQSLQIQDRSTNNVKGTASPTGVVQVTPIEQLNAKALSIGTSAVTPADGEIRAVKAIINSGASSDTVSIEAATDCIAQINAAHATGEAVLELKNSVDAANTWRVQRAHAGSFEVKDQSAGATRLVIDSAGNVGIQVAAPRATLHVNDSTGTSEDCGVIQISNYDTSFADTTALGVLQFGGTRDNTNWGVGASINAEAAEAWDATGELGTDLYFKTCPIGSASLTTRLTIGSDGATTLDGTVSVGGTANGLLYVKEDDGSNAIQLRADVSNLYNEIDSTKEFNIRTEAGALRFSTVNIERLRIDTAGSVTATAASAGGWSMTTSNTSATGWGMQVKGGADSGDRSFEVQSQAGAQLLLVDGGGLTTVAAITETNGVLRSNLLTNSAFGVWSNSTLEDVTGTNLVSAWTNHGSYPYDTFTSSGANITRAEKSVSAGADIATAPISTTEGKLYEISFTMTLASPSLTYPSIYVASTETGVSGAVAQRTVGGAQTVVFEAAADSDYMIFRNEATELTDFAVTSFTLTEVTPGCVAADVLAMDGWGKSSSLDIWRQHNDGGTLTHDGSFYGLKTTTASTGQHISWHAYPASISDEPFFIQRFAGRTMTLGAWVKTSTASHASLRLYDGTGTSSGFHTGGGGWEWLEVTKTISATPTYFWCFLDFAITATDAYISQPMLVFGSAIGEGNYSAPSGEIVWCEKAFSSNSLYANGFSDVGDTTMNLEADTNGKFPKGAKAFMFSGEVRDSASSTSDGYLFFRRDTAGYVAAWVSPAGLANDKYGRASGASPCDANGDYSYKIEASGSATTDVYLNYSGVQLR